MIDIALAVIIVHTESALRHSLKSARPGSTIVIPDDVAISVTAPMLIDKPSLTLQGGTVLCATREKCFFGSVTFSVRDTVFYSNIDSNEPIFHIEHKQVLKSVGGTRSRVMPSLVWLENISVDIQGQRLFALFADFDALRMKHVVAKTSGHQVVVTNRVNEIQIGGDSVFVATGTDTSRAARLNARGLIVPRGRFVRKGPLPVAQWGSMPLQLFDALSVNLDDCLFDGPWSSVMYVRTHGNVKLSGVTASQVKATPIVVEASSPLVTLTLHKSSFSVPELGVLLASVGRGTTALELQQTGLSGVVQYPSSGSGDTSVVLDQMCRPISDIASGQVTVLSPKGSSWNGISILNAADCEALDIAFTNLIAS